MSENNNTSDATEYLPRNSNDFIEQQLHIRVQAIEDCFDADVITFCGPVRPGVDDLIRLAVERKSRQIPQREKLVMVVTTTGGSIEVVHRIVDTLRTHYQLVDFVVPNGFVA